MQERRQQQEGKFGVTKKSTFVEEEEHASLDPLFVMEWSTALEEMTNNSVQTMII
jgi:hypothetical protein